jgi:hypothetical protein
MSKPSRHERLSIIEQRLKYRQLRRLVNASLRCAARCEFLPPTAEKCETCKNPDCIIARDELNAFWQECDSKC